MVQKSGVHQLRLVYSLSHCLRQVLYIPGGFSADFWTIKRYIINFCWKFGMIRDSSRSPFSASRAKWLKVPTFPTDPGRILPSEAIFFFQKGKETYQPRCWFQIFVISTPIWGRFPIWQKKLHGLKPPTSNYIRCIGHMGLNLKGSQRYLTIFSY